MSSTNRNNARGKWIPLAVVALFSAITAILFSACNQNEARNVDNKNSIETNQDKATADTDALKVLYVTHEPGKYHDYTAQRKIFEQIAEKNKWNVTIISTDHDSLITKLANSPDFGKDADVIVYNICMAKCDDPMVPYNIIQQTEKKGKPALLIHCALHSFWPTFKEKGENAIHAPGANPKAHTKKEILAKWQKENPNKKFPSWPNFTGFASTHHSPQGPVQCERLLKDHAVFKGVDDYTTNKGAELYYNFIGPEDEKNVVSMLKGKNKHGEAIMLWENQVGTAKVLSFTLGHSTGEWQQPPYQKILGNTINYLGKK